MNSIILIHDGIWLSPRPSAIAVDDAAQYASNMTGLFKIRVKFSSLLPEHLVIKKAILQAAGLNPQVAHPRVNCKDTLAYITRDEWWRFIAEPKPAPLVVALEQTVNNMTQPLGTAARRRNASCVVTDVGPLDAYFKRRKLAN
jgi:hypothetical protein